MKIVGVAILCENTGDMYQLPPPNRHHDVIRVMAKNAEAAVGQQGFVTDLGYFVGRHEAMKIAVAAGQLKRREGAKFYQGPELFSEDLW